MEEQVVKPMKKDLSAGKFDKLVTTDQGTDGFYAVDFKFGVDVDNKYQEISTEVNALKNSECRRISLLSRFRD